MPPKRTGDGQVIQDAITPSGKDAADGATNDKGPLPMGYSVGKGGETKDVGYPQTTPPVVAGAVSPSKETNVYREAPTLPKVTK